MTAMLFHHVTKILNQLGAASGIGEALTELCVSK